MKRIDKALLTGASGFIGRRVREALLAEGTEVVAIRRKGSPASDSGRTVEAAYDDTQGLSEIMAAEKPDVVFHIAGITKGRSYADFERGNVMPTRNLLAALEHGHSGVTRFVHVSSLAAYGPAAPGRPLCETDPRQPIEHYGRSKREAERVVEQSNVPYTIVRPSGVYGPGDVDYFELFKAANLRMNLFFGNKDKWFSAIYVDDCVRGILAAATHPATLNQGYFLTEDEPTTWRRFQEEIARATGKRAVTVDLPEALVTLAAHAGELATRLDGKARLMNRQKALMSAQAAWLCSGAKARTDFEFDAEVGAREGARRTHEWYRDNAWYRRR